MCALSDVHSDPLSQGEFLYLAFLDRNVMRAIAVELAPLAFMHLKPS